MVDLYVKPSISGYNDNPPPDDDSETAANAVSWAKHKTKLSDPIKTLVDSINTKSDELADKLFGNAVTALSGGYSLATSDYGKLFKTTNAITLTLLTGTDAGGNFVFAFYNADASDNLTIARNGNNINGSAANVTVYPKQGGFCFCDGTDWWVIIVVTNAGNNTLSGDNDIKDTLEIYNSADSTKKVRISAGTVSAGNTRVLTMGDANFTIAASTQAEQEAGSSITTITTPGRQHFHPSAAKAWANFSGSGTPALRVSYNVTGITDHGTGDWSLNFTTSFSSGDSCAVCTARASSTDVRYAGAVGFATGSVRVVTQNSSSANYDSDVVCVVCYGDL